MAKHAVVVTVLAVCTATAQNPKAGPTFDVAAIRQTDLSAPRGECYMRGQAGGQTFTGRCIPLALIIKRAYRLIDSQLTGGPDWINTTLFDFEAKTDRPTTRADVEPLFQAFLAERFNLKMHTEPRNMQALVLTVDPGGNKMTPNKTDYEWDIPIQRPPNKIPKVKGVRCPMTYFSWYLGQLQNRPVIDHTGLTGFWDFTFEYVPDNFAEIQAKPERKGPDGEAAPAIDGPNIYAALHEQLGLKLQAQKTNVDVYVIDHVEKPGAN
jgi:uncharacterized protein (TIGR03435 family)